MYSLCYFPFLLFSSLDHASSSHVSSSLPCLLRSPHHSSSQISYLLWQFVFSNLPCLLKSPLSSSFVFSNLLPLSTVRPSPLVLVVRLLPLLVACFSTWQSSLTHIFIGWVENLIGVVRVISPNNLKVWIKLINVFQSNPITPLPEISKDKFKPLWG